MGLWRYLFHDVRKDLEQIPPPAQTIHIHSWEQIQYGNPVRAQVWLWGCPVCTKVACTKIGAEPNATD